MEITRRGFLRALGIGAGAAMAPAVVSAQEKWASSVDDNRTPDQKVYERIQVLQAKIRILHNSPQAIVNSYDKSDVAQEVLTATLTNRATIAGVERAPVSYKKGDPELFFVRSRFVAAGAEIKQDSESTLPNELSEQNMLAILNSIDSWREWESTGFTPYSQVNERYSDLYGSVTALIPSDDLPKDHFTFVYSHAPKKGLWTMQRADSFEVETQGKSFIFVNYDTYNPKLKPASTTLTEPTGDTIAFFITDINGKPLQKMTIGQPHWTK